MTPMLRSYYFCNFFHWVEFRDGWVPRGLIGRPHAPPDTITHQPIRQHL